MQRDEGVRWVYMSEGMGWARMKGRQEGAKDEMELEDERQVGWWGWESEGGEGTVVDRTCVSAFHSLCEMIKLEI